MTELVFVVCLAMSPEVCERQTVNYVGVSQRVCILSAPPELARWSKAHPGWTVRDWRCRPAGQSHDA